MIAFVRPIYFFFFFICFCLLLIFINGQDENEFSRYEEEEELGPPGLTSADFNSKSISKSIEGSTNN